MCRVASDAELFRVEQIGAVDDGLVLCKDRPRSVNSSPPVEGVKSESRAIRTIPWTTAAIEHMKICA